MTDVSQLARAAARADRPTAAQPFDAKRMLDDLLRHNPQHRAEFVTELPERDQAVLIDTVHAEMGTPYGLWRDDPVGFALGPMRLSPWSAQRRVLRSISVNKKTAVPSTVGVGKTFIAATAVTWWCSVWPPGSALAVTTATRFRQVQRQIWPEIRSLHAMAKLAGHCDTTQWKVTTSTGMEWVAAYGFSPPDWDEAAAQGIHARAALLLIIDEAGGIGQIIGQAFESIMTGERTRMLAIGNPPTDVEGSWFEQLTTREETNTIPISVFSTPLYTGETVGVCLACPPGLPEHDAAEHIGDPTWEPRVRKDFGIDSPYYQARALARFPRGGPSRAIPGDWLDSAVDIGRGGNDRPKVITDRTGVAFPFQPQPRAWIRLGVDVAAGGGDELAIARIEGDVGRIVHHESGTELADPHYAAGQVLTQIRIAEQLRAELGTKAKIRVKIDAIGVGIGCAGILETWGKEGVHDADIVRVNVSEKPEEGRRDSHELFRPYLKRDEMWLAMRLLLQPDPLTQEPEIALDIDDQSRAQLAAPKMGNMSGGFTKIEEKDKVKKRLGRSPDRAEALLLAVYEPYDLIRRRRRTIISGA